jgi:putative CocE/NonD family hydrolase
MFTMVARSSIYNQSAFMGGVFRKELNEGWLKREHAESMIGETLNHNIKDHFFDSNEMELHWSDIQVPAYNYGGWYDIFLQGNVNDFAGLQSRGGGLAAGNQKLMMGPWGHGNLEEVKYPANSAVNANDEAIRWFDYWLKGNKNGIMNEPPIKYYVMGDVTDPAAPGNQWRTAMSWPPPARTTSYFLLPGGGLSRKIPESGETKDTYRYDPADPVPTVGGGNLFLKKGPMDQRAVGDRKDVLKYQTPPLDEPVEVTGRVTVELWAESDAPDTDWMAKLVDVYPNGAERLVLDSAARARFRDGFDHEAFLEKGHVYRFRIDLWSTSLIFNKGHRIEVQVSSSNFPRFEKNLNNGKPYSAEGEARVATNSVHHDRAHPSRILLPLVPASDGKQP